MKKKFLLFSVIFCFVICYVKSQTRFQKLIGNVTNSSYAKCIQPTTDGGYIIAGETDFGAGASDFYLVKTDSVGNSIWKKTLGSTAGDWGESVQQTIDGGYIIVGTTEGFGVSQYGILLIKTDNSGNSQWAKTFDRPENDYGYSVSQCVDSGFIVAGILSDSASNSYVCLIKTDVNGDTLWTKTFRDSSGFSGAYSVQQTNDGGYILTGFTFGMSGGGNEDINLIKTDSNGDTLWTRAYGGPVDDEGHFVKQTTDSGYIITGKGGDAFYGDVYLIKTDVNGDTMWTKRYGGVDAEVGYCVNQTTDGGYIISGATQTFAPGAGDLDSYLIKTDSNGDTLWTRTFGGIYDEESYSVLQASDGGYIFAGENTSYLSGNNILVSLIKTDPNGNSGCNENTPPTIVSSTITQISIPPIAISAGVVVNTSVIVAGSGGSDTTICSSNVGINQIYNFKFPISISPNPSADNFVITLSDIISNGVIEIYNPFGEKMLTEKINSELQKEINVKSISDGIYFVKVFDGEKYYCRKIIIEKD